MKGTGLKGPLLFRREGIGRTHERQQAVKAAGRNAMSIVMLRVGLRLEAAHCVRADNHMANPASFNHRSLLTNPNRETSATVEYRSFQFLQQLVRGHRRAPVQLISCLRCHSVRRQPMACPVNLREPIACHKLLQTAARHEGI